MTHCPPQYRISSPWGETRELPDLTTALIHLDTSETCDWCLEHWIEGGWVRVDI